MYLDIQKLVGGVLVISLLFMVYIYHFIFLHGSPNKGTDNDKWIRLVVFGPKGDITKTTRTWGFFKASFREFRRYCRTLFSTEPQATMGKIAPGGDVFTLDGEKSSLEDFIDGVPRDMPLILNIGSYT
mmetsp:Transcript_26196/g.44171  ORF Transcript_26196/g.44171 Transcript_26196/m.44171 type:complete len:128 (+) Transcript_26196:70-453(+)